MRMSDSMKAVWLVMAVVVVSMVMVGVNSDHVPYRYTIRLEDPPEKRYYHVVRDICRDKVHEGVIRTLLDDIEGYLKQMNFFPMLSVVGAAFNKTLPEVYKEVDGISKYLAKYCDLHVSTDELATLQVVYQVAMSYFANTSRRDVDETAVFDRNVDPLYERIRASLSSSTPSHFGAMGCTSIVVADSEGHVVHGRNLDWISAHLYQPLATELTFTRNDEVVAVTMSFFPELSPTTVISHKAAFSFNARTVEPPNFYCLLGDHPMDPFSLIVRQRMLKDDTDSTYESLVSDFMNKASLCAPAYIVLSGPGKDQGVLFTFPVQNHPRVLNVSSVERSRENGERGEETGDTRKPWYVVVANDDIEYEYAANWSARYNLTLDILSRADQSVLSTMESLDKDLLNISGIRTDGTCYEATMDVRNFKYRFYVRSTTVDENAFYQNFSDVPPEEEEKSHDLEESISSLSRIPIDDMPFPAWVYIAICAAVVLLVAVITGVAIGCTAYSRRSGRALRHMLERDAHTQLEDEDSYSDVEIEDVTGYPDEAIVSTPTGKESVNKASTKGTVASSSQHSDSESSAKKVGKKDAKKKSTKTVEKKDVKKKSTKRVEKKEEDESEESSGSSTGSDSETDSSSGSDSSSN